MNSYELSRAWFDYGYLNPHKIKPIHTAIYFFAIDHCNRLGWKEIFGFPTTMAMDAIGVKSYKTYISALNEIVEWGFITMHERSKNQYSSNIIALVKNTEAHTKADTKALDKAMSKHALKQSQSTDQSIVSINKPNNLKTLKPKNGGNEKNTPIYDYPKTDDDPELIDFFTNNGGNEKMASKFFNHFNAQGWVRKNGMAIIDWYSQAKMFIDEELHNPKFKTAQTESDYTKYQREFGW
jgi:hypothetical protein